MFKNINGFEEEREQYSASKGNKFSDSIDPSFAIDN